MQKIIRNTNIELLRIVSMVMIIAHHYVYYGVMQNYNSEVAYLAYQQRSAINKLMAQLLLPGGIVGVGVFFLIMGYFGIQSNNIKIQQVVKETFLYSLIGLLVYVLCGIFGLVEITNSKSSILSCLIPVASSTYWFITVYIIISMMKGFINSVVETIGGGIKQYFGFFFC